MLLNGLFTVFGLISLAILLLVVVAFVDAAVRPPAAFVAADKQTKNLWLIILGVVGAALFVFGRGVFSLPGIAGAIAGLVYVLDVRPALKAVSGGGGRGRRGGGSSSDGPYGPANNRW